MPKALDPLPHPPPPGSPWARVEAARQKLGWSARKLSEIATGKPGSSHYSVIAKRNGWDSVELGTLESFIRAVVVEGGVPEAEVRGAGAIPEMTMMVAETTAPYRSAPRVLDTLAMAEEAAEMLESVDHVPAAKAWKLMRGIKLNAPSTKGYYIEARLRLKSHKSGEVAPPDAARALEHGEAGSKRRRSSNG